MAQAGVDKLQDSQAFPALQYRGRSRPPRAQLICRQLTHAHAQAWLGMVLLLITETEEFLGQASFFVLVIAFMTPPDKPFVQVLEVHLFSLVFVALAWLWTVVAAEIADAVRVEHVAAADLDTALALTGRYLEARPTIVCAVFLFVGIGFFAWMKLRVAPGPLLFPCVFACVPRP